MPRKRPERGGRGGGAGVPMEGPSSRAGVRAMKRAARTAPAESSSTTATKQPAWRVRECTLTQARRARLRRRRDVAPVGEVGAGRRRLRRQGRRRLDRRRPRLGLLPERRKWSAHQVAARVKGLRLMGRVRRLRDAADSFNRRANSPLALGRPGPATPTRGCGAILFGPRHALSASSFEEDPRSPGARESGPSAPKRFTETPYEPHAPGRHASCSSRNARGPPSAPASLRSRRDARCLLG